VGKQAARGVVGRLSCLLKNSTHLERLAIMKSGVQGLSVVPLNSSVFRAGATKMDGAAAANHKNR
jgi:hypothetical protein